MSQRKEIVSICPKVEKISDIETKNVMSDLESLKSTSKKLLNFYFVEIITSLVYLFLLMVMGMIFFLFSFSFFVAFFDTNALIETYPSQSLSLTSSTI